ncbi:MAG TPA: undecaprenyl-diphosphate phosphatase [Phycisphaerales bacterium]|nr:undecaprenyl-diphosphate phosphatase [Phycisphaerales bacterium]
MTIFEAIILGLVEGITEYLPISSTGHLILTEAALGLNKNPATKSAVDTFTIVIQFGAILAVLGLYRTHVMRMIRGMMGKDSVGLKMATNVVIAVVPVLFIAKLLKDHIESKLFFPGPVLGALAVGGIVMLAIGPWQKKRVHDDRGEQPPPGVTMETLSPQQALIIGIIQCLALWPGTSRSMVTIVGGMLIGMRPKQAAEFSFILGLPTLAAACAYSLWKNVHGHDPNMFDVLGVWPIVIGILVATVSAAIAIAWLVRFLTQHGLAIFGWYRLILCGVFAMLIAQHLIELKPDAPKSPEPAAVHTPSN